jgi:hypothetical protein
MGQPDRGVVTGADHGSHRRGPLFWLSALAGWALIGWGIRGLLHFHVDTRPAELARFFVGGLLAHDAVFAPLVLLGGVALSRLAPPSRLRSYLQAAFIICGSLALFAYPEVRDYARILHNPTSLPHNYTRNLVIVWAGVGAALAALALIRSGRRSPR